MDPEIDIRDYFRGSKGQEEEMGFLEDLVQKRENKPGLGDYHLRSAIKAVQLAKLKENKGRKREKRDFQAFVDYTRVDIDDIVLGDITKFLSYFLYFHQAISSKIKDTALNDNIEEDNMIAREIVTRRIKMEMIRDGMYQSENEDNTLRKQILDRLNKLDLNDYSHIRCLSESIILGMNSIASKREFPQFLKEHVITGKGESGSIEYFITGIGNLILFCAGDLVFFKPDIDDIWSSIGESNDFLIEEIFNHAHTSHFLKLVPDDGNSFWMKEINNQKWNVVNADVMRMVNDKITERDILIRSCDWFHDTLSSVYPHRDIIEHVFYIGDLALCIFGNKAYKMIKVFESLVVGVLLSRCNSIIVDKREFLTSTVTDLETEHPEFSGFLRTWTNYLSGLSNDHHISQIYGLYRLWGHPEINSQEGLGKVMRLGKAKKDIVPELSVQAGYHFMEEIYIRYRRKWGRYPPFKIYNNEEPVEVLSEQNYLIQCLLSNAEIDIKSDRYILSSWNLVDTQKTFDIPATFNLTMVVDDKAISPPKSHLISVAKKEKSLMDPFERRGVLKFMKYPFVECHDFLKSINDNSLDDDDCVIGLYPKERELNSVPRMFSLMSAKMRNYVVVTEHMIADDILPYFPQITMTNDLLNLTKKIYSTTRKQEINSMNSSFSKGNKMTYDLSVCINMDFEKWNLNMRKESTNDVFYQMGKLYGMENLFNRTYDIFNSCYIYVSDENFVLKTQQNKETGKTELKTDDVSSYTGHVGGFEGLRQKGWTVFTVVVIKMILEKYPVTYKLMGQGDNQVLMITMSTGFVDKSGHLMEKGKEELVVLLQDIMRSLETIFKGLGLPLKTLESWKSEELFLYGKFPVKNGVPLCMSLKKICRAFPFSNDDSMTIDNVMGSIFTNAQSAAMADIYHYPSYVSGLYEMVVGLKMLFRYHPMTGRSLTDEIIERPYWFTYENIVIGDSSRSKRINTRIEQEIELDSLIDSIAIMPKSLGGSNGITEYEFLMRGFPDNQTRDLTYLSELAIACVNAKDDLDKDINDLATRIFRICRLNFSISQNYDFLVEDPCALNLLQPETPLTLLRKKVKSTLSKNASFENKSFMELFKLTTDERKRELLLCLADSDTLFPRILHDCYAATLFGFVDGIVSKVDKTVTVQRMCLENSKDDIIEAIMKVEENFIKYLVWRATHYRRFDYPGEPSLKCPTNYMRWSRNYSWKKDIQGVGVPYPSHILRYEGKRDTLTCDNSDRISCHISDYTPDALPDLVGTLGRAPPYLGSMTKEKIKSYDRVALYSSEPLLKRVIHLMKAVSWGNLRDSNLKTFLDNVLSSVSDIDGSIFMLSKDDVGGSIEHRYRDMALKHGALASFMYGIGTWLHLSTDDFSKYSKGSKNVTLHFQAILCWTQAKMYEILINRCLTDEKSCIKEYHFHLACEDCIIPVQYDVPDIPQIPRSIIPELKENPYCFTDNVTLSTRDRSAFSHSELFTINLSMKISEIPVRDVKYLFHEYWASEICKDIMCQTDIDEGSVGVSVLELNKYPRIAFLRIEVQQLLDLILDNLFMNELTHVAKMDRYKELSLTVTSAYSSVKNRLTECPNYSFIGLSVLFSWPEKMFEILRLDNTVMPRTKAISINEGLQGSRNLLISYLENSYVPLLRYCSIMNLQENQSIFSSLKLRYFSYVNALDSEYCRECRRELLLNLNEENIDEGSKDAVCFNGHHWFRKDFILKKLQVVCFPEDLLSKHTASKSISISRSKDCDKWRDLLQIYAGWNKDHVKIYQITKNDMKFEQIQESVGEYNVRYKKDTWQVSRLYRCVPYDVSTVYRLLEVVLGSRVLRSQGKAIFALGDGMGSSSMMLEKLTGKRIIASSLLDSTLSFPQTFPHSMPSGYYDAEGSDNLDYSLEKKFINNIWSDDFIMRSDEYLARQGGIMFGYCDIELEHKESVTAGGQRKFPYSELVKKLFQFKSVPEWIVKVRLNDTLETYHILEVALLCFSSAEVLISPFCNFNKGEIFIQIKGPREFVRDRKDTLLSTRTRQKIRERMIFYTEGKLFESLDREYFEKLNDVVLSGGILNKSLSMMTQWFNEGGLNFSVETSNFTNFFLSVLSKRNPMQHQHHTDHKERYEYISDLQAIGNKILVLGLSSILLDSCVSYHLDNLDNFVIVRPSKTMRSRSGKFITKYTYVICHISKIGSVKKEYPKCDLSVLPPVRLVPLDSVNRYLPLLRMILKRQSRLQSVRFLRMIVFKYIPRSSMNRTFVNEKQDIYLPISKSYDINIRD